MTDVIEAMARGYLMALAPGGFPDIDAAILSRLEAMRAAIAAAEEAGFILAPKEPTEAMVHAGKWSINQVYADDAIDAVYRAMLEKAPKP